MTEIIGIAGIYLF